MKEKTTENSLASNDAAWFIGLINQSDSAKQIETRALCTNCNVQAIPGEME